MWTVPVQDCPEGTPPDDFAAPTFASIREWLGRWAKGEDLFHRMIRYEDHPTARARIRTPEGVVVTKPVPVLIVRRPGELD